MSPDPRASRVAWVRTLIGLAVAVVVQVTVLDRLDPGGVIRFDLPLLLVVAVGLWSRADDAALLGFAAGVGVDLFHVGPFGHHSLVYCLVGLAVAGVSSRLEDHHPVVGSVAATTLHRAARRALLAATAAMTAGVGLLLVRAAAEPMVPPVDQIVMAQPLSGLVGSIVGINLLAPSIRRLGLVAEPAGSVGSRWLPFDRRESLAGSFLTARRS